MKKSWQFKKPNRHGSPTVEITVELDDHLGAFADDDYYYGDLTREESLDLARETLKALDPPACVSGDPARVVDGAMCGAHGIVLGTVRENGYVILKCREGIILQPAQFVKVGL